MEKEQVMNMNRRKRDLSGRLLDNERRDRQAKPQASDQTTGRGKTSQPAGRRANSETRMV